MKNVLRISLVVAFLIGLSSFKFNKKEEVKETEMEAAFAEMTFKKIEHDFGEIKEGDVVKTVFEFENTGNAPLVIVSMKGSCGCTVPNDWKKDPIMPGEKGRFTVEFNSKGKPNMQHKTVTITANTKKGRELVKIKALVQPNKVKS